MRRQQKTISSGHSATGSLKYRIAKVSGREYFGNYCELRFIFRFMDIFIDRMPFMRIFILLLVGDFVPTMAVGLCVEGAADIGANDGVSVIGLKAGKSIEGNKVG